MCRTRRSDVSAGTSADGSSKTTSAEALLEALLADLRLSGAAPDLGRPLSDDDGVESLTTFIHQGLGGA
jgi:hypothetical protein